MCPSWLWPLECRYLCCKPSLPREDSKASLESGSGEYLLLWDQSRLSIILPPKPSNNTSQTQHLDMAKDLIRHAANDPRSIVIYTDDEAPRAILPLSLGPMNSPNLNKLAPFFLEGEECSVHVIYAATNGIYEIAMCTSGREPGICIGCPGAWNVYWTTCDLLHKT